MSVRMSMNAPRSPRFPRFSLEQSIAYAHDLYRGVHRSPVDANTAYRIMGFAGKSGSSATALGSVRQFGLVDGLRGDLKISDLALKIFEPTDEAERRAALPILLRNPEVFAQIFRQFGDKIPNANEAIRAFLIRQLEFSPSGADDCIESLRLSISFVEANQPAGPGIESEVQSSESGIVAGPLLSDPQNVSIKSHIADETASQLIKIPLGKESSAEVRLYGPITSEIMDRLIAHLQLTKAVWE